MYTLCKQLVRYLGDNGKKRNLYMLGTDVIFFPNIFDVQLVESLDVRPTDPEAVIHLALLPLVQEGSGGEEGGSGRRGRGGGGEKGKKAIWGKSFKSTWAERVIRKGRTKQNHRQAPQQNSGESPEPQAESKRIPLHLNLKGQGPVPHQTLLSPLSLLGSRSSRVVLHLGDSRAAQGWPGCHAYPQVCP